MEKTLIWETHVAIWSNRVKSFQNWVPSKHSWCIFSKLATFKIGSNHFKNRVINWSQLIAEGTLPGDRPSLNRMRGTPSSMPPSFTSWDHRLTIGGLKIWDEALGNPISLILGWKIQQVWNHHLIYDLPSGYSTVHHGKPPIEIDGLPINSMVIFHGYVTNNQMVSLDIISSEKLRWPSPMTKIAGSPVFAMANSWVESVNHLGHQHPMIHFQFDPTTKSLSVQSL